MKNIYFGHPIDIYSTPLESNLVEAIKEKFPDKHIENPNQPHHADGYKRFKESTGNGMNYYYERVLPYMDLGVFLAFPDGMIGAGVYNEAEFLNNQGSPIYEITREGKITDLELDEERRLSIEDTVARVRPS